MYVFVPVLVNGDMMTLFCVWLDVTLIFLGGRFKTGTLEQSVMCLFESSCVDICPTVLGPEMVSFV